MTTRFRRTAGRLAAAALATTALTGAAVAGAQAAQAGTSCDESAVAKTFTAVLALRTGSTDNPTPCR
jgi:hypothetical protein